MKPSAFPRPARRPGPKRLAAIAVAAAASLFPAFAAGGEDPGAGARLEAEFRTPPEEARPWTYWYWMDGAVSGAGITADLEAMKQAGLEGAYLMPVRGVPNPPLFEPSANQLSPEWWALVKHAFSEADRLGLKLALHACDGWSAAGGPWITPELSMQKVVWSATQAEGGRPFSGTLARPPAYQGYYKDIAVLAYPSPPGAGEELSGAAPLSVPPGPANSGASGRSPQLAVVTTSVPGAEAGFLAVPGNRKAFHSDAPCWIQFAFKEPFTCRSIVIRPGGGNYEANRLLVSVSDDGVSFREVERLVPPRHGWQDGDADVTHSLPATTAKYFRFAYDPEGSEPGAEDLDSAKWLTGLNLQGIVLSGAARINQFEGKNGEVWRVSERTTPAMAPESVCVPLDRIVVLTDRLAADGRLDWTPPAGRWTILRIGHTSTGHRNEKGGGGRGLECDKLSAAAAKVQFDHWFGAAIREVGPELAGRVLKIFHVDSWECGSQNWTADFREEFLRRRGYDLLPWLPAMAGIPVQSADRSERFLHDVRQTVAELLAERFYGTLEGLARAAGCRFSAECVAPTMLSDGMLHYREVDLPQGEFWLRSPTNDKLNDILDAVSGARVYGKRIVQAEAFTELQIGWDEAPALLKPLADRNYCFGINRFVFHVFTENPWIDRRPGMTLDGVGSFFQRDQTWWTQGRAWIDYTRRCQALLQEGRPVADIAVFTGEELPRRAVIPAQLVDSLRGLFGPDIVERESNRMENRGVPLTELPDGNIHTAISDPGDWSDALRGYAYDSINPDALLRLAAVRGGRIVLPGGASYGVLVIPASRPMSPDASLMTPEVAARLRELAAEGATVILGERPRGSPSLQNYPACDTAVGRIAAELWPEAAAASPDSPAIRRIGLGRVIDGPFEDGSLTSLGIERDVIATDAAESAKAGPADRIGWTHRIVGDADVYFLSNPAPVRRTLNVSLRSLGRLPELWDPVTGEIRPAGTWRIEHGRTALPVQLAAGGSVFIVFRSPTSLRWQNGRGNWEVPVAVPVQLAPWQVTFAQASGGPAGPVAFDHLESWSAREEPGIRFYSGTARYSTSFPWNGPRRRMWLDLGRVANVAQVLVNGVDCGTVWTPPYRVEVTSALRAGANELEVRVTNTWANRLKGDRDLPPGQRITFTANAPYRLDHKPLLEAGLLGPVALLREPQE